MQQIKPVRAAFVFPSVVAGLALATVASVVVVFAGLIVEPTLFALLPLAWVLLPGPIVYRGFVAWGKERYEVHDDHLVAHRGGLMSSARTELDIHNVTHVRLRLPWLRHYFFRIGDVRVESAGSAQAEITLRSVRDPEAIYEQVQQRMRDNGFSLRRGEVLHQESPGPLGALTDIVRTSLGLLSTLPFLIVGAVGLTAGIADAGSDVAALLATLLGFGIGLGSVVLSVGGLVVRYLDLTRRTYTVHEDVIVYTEGFLTRDNAFIPFENIADATTNRTPIDQVLGLYDIKVSCQGSASEIHFRRLARGPELQAAIAALVARGGEVKRHAARDRGGEASVATNAPSRGKAARPRDLVEPDQAWTADLKMHPLRSQAPMLLLLVAPPVWLFAAIATAVRTLYTTYAVGADSVAVDYTFIGASHQEFAYDKVTGVQVSEGPLDRLFGTMTVQIWSIGSPQPLTLGHVLAEDVDLPALLRQCGIPSHMPAQGRLRQSLSPVVWAIQNVFLLSMLAAAGGLAVALAAVDDPQWLLVLPLLAVVPIASAAITYIRIRRQQVTFHEEHLETQIGRFFHQHTWVRYDEIKKVETVRIPFTDQGTFKVYVAGERVAVQQKTGQSSGAKVPYTVQGHYIEDIDNRLDAMDALMLGLIEPSQIEGAHAQDDDVLSVSRPALANEVVGFALIGILFPPLWLFLPVLVLQIRARRYSVETDRVVARKGILFRSAASILYHRIDSLQQSQGPMGKIFGNGRVTILTAGSSNPDMVIRNVPDYQQVYGTVRTHYGKLAASGSEPAR